MPNSPSEYSLLFFLQLIVILGTCRAVGIIAKRVGQPQVIAEMIAGVLLGPSLLGYLQPEWSGFLFPEGSKRILFSVSQLGLALFMFVVGVEFQSEHFVHKSRTASLVSISGMVTPCLLGALLGVWFHSQGGLFPESVTMPQAMLFMGASMCITAFPMLARIIFENGLSGTTLGTLVLAAGAIDDVAAWCVLAIVVASPSGNWSSAALAIGGGLAYAIFVFTVAKPLLRLLVSPVEKNGKLSETHITLILIFMAISAYATDLIGVHAVFGTFLLGCAMPRGIVATEIKNRFLPLTVGLLIPLFFTYSGLNTRLDLVATPRLLALSLVILVVAVLGKGIACWAACRLSGESQGMSLAIGALMNARGMMELILLNIAREKGLIGPELFSMLVIMAIITTVAASPLFRWVRRRYRLFEDDDSVEERAALKPA